MAEFDDYPEQEIKNPRGNIRNEISQIRKKLAVLRQERLSLDRDVNKRKLARVQTEISAARKEYSALRATKKANRSELLTKREGELAGPKAKIKREPLAKPTTPEAPKAASVDMHEYLGAQSDVKELLTDMSERLGSVLDSVKDQYGSFEQAYKSLDENNSKLVKEISGLSSYTQSLLDGSVKVDKESLATQEEMLSKIKEQAENLEDIPDAIKEGLEDNFGGKTGGKPGTLNFLLRKLSIAVPRMNELGEKIASHEITEELVTGLGQSFFGPSFVILDNLTKSVLGTGTTIETLTKLTKGGFKGLIAIPKLMFKGFKGLVAIPKLIMTGFVFGKKTLSRVKSIAESSIKFGGATVKSIEKLSSTQKEELVEEELSKKDSKKSIKLLSNLLSKITLLGRLTKGGFKEIAVPLEDIGNDVSKMKKEQKKKSMLGMLGGGEGGGGTLNTIKDLLMGYGGLKLGGGLLGKGGLGKIAGGIGSAAGAIAPYALPALGVAGAGVGGYAIGTGIDKLITKFSGGKTLGESVYDLFHRKENKPTGDIAKLSKVLQTKMSPEAWDLYGKDLVDQTATPSQLLKQGKLVESGGKWKLPEEAVESPGNASPKSAVSPTGEVVTAPKKPPVTTEPPPAPTRSPEKVPMTGGSPRSIEGRSIRSFPVLVDDLGLIIANSGLL